MHIFWSQKMEAAAPKKSKKKCAPAANSLENRGAPRPKCQAASVRGDDLTALEGIGPVTAEVLRSAGIRRFHDFLAHTPESLSQVLLDRAGVALSPAQIRTHGWLEAARELVPGRIHDHLSARGDNFLKKENDAMDENLRQKETLNAAGETREEKSENKPPEEDRNSGSPSPELGAGTASPQSHSEQPDETIPPAAQARAKGASAAAAGRKTKRKKKKSRGGADAGRERGERQKQHAATAPEPDHGAAATGPQEKPAAPGLQLTDLVIMAPGAGSGGQAQLFAEARFSFHDPVQHFAVEADRSVYLQIQAIEEATGVARLLATHRVSLTQNQAEHQARLPLTAPPRGVYRLLAILFFPVGDSVIDMRRGPILRVTD